MRIGLLGPVETAAVGPLLDRPVADLPPGQAGSPVTLLATELVQAGHDVRIWTLDTSVDAPVTAAGPALDVTYLPKRGGGRGRDAYAQEISWVRRALREGPDVDVLNAHWSYEFALGAIDRPEPLVVTVHDWAPTIFRYSPDPYRAARLTMFARTHLRRPAMTTPSPYLRAKLRRFGLGDATVVPNGVALDTFAEGHRRRGPDMHVVGISRGFDRRKNSRALIAAHALLRRIGMPIRLTLFGHAHEADGPARAWAREQGMADGVTFAGEVPYAQVLSVLRDCDLFVHPAREESFGMVLVEAMAQGTPVVAGVRSGAVPWVLADGRAGSLVDVERPGAIAAEVQRLLGSSTAWEQRSRDGWSHARSHYAMDRVAAGYHAAYVSVLG
jgi:L-malate glycosyltransferase